jgi:hypothetical protein
MHHSNATSHISRISFDHFSLSMTISLCIKLLLAALMEGVEGDTKTILLSYASISKA